MGEIHHAINMSSPEAWKIAIEDIEWRKSEGHQPHDVFRAITGQSVSWASWETATALIAAVWEAQNGDIHKTGI